jgi:hypothetical protein
MGQLYAPKQMIGGIRDVGGRDREIAKQSGGQYSSASKRACRQSKKAPSESTFNIDRRFPACDAMGRCILFHLFIMHNSEKRVVTSKTVDLCSLR